MSNDVNPVAARKGNIASLTLKFTFNLKKTRQV
jgi:hypothetical protein